MPVNSPQLGGGKGKWLTTAAAAILLGVGSRYLYRLREEGKLHAFAIGEGKGTTLLWRRDDVLEYAASHPRLGTQRRTTLVAV